MFGADVCGLKIASGGGMISGFTTLAAIMHECGAHVQDCDDEDEDGVAYIVAGSGGEAKSSLKGFG